MSINVVISRTRAPSDISQPTKALPRRGSTPTPVLDHIQGCFPPSSNRLPQPNDRTGRKDKNEAMLRHQPTKHTVLVGPERALRMLADRRKELTKRSGAKDQDFPVETIRYVPNKMGGKRPLVVVGGMGPLAGQDALAAAIEAHPDREIVLMQLCSAPCRIAPLVSAEANQRKNERCRVAQALAAGVIHGLDAVDTGQRVDLIVSCNTAHAYMDESLELLRRWSPSHHRRMRFVPLMEGVVAAASKIEGVTVLCLYTDGVRISGTYRKHFDEKSLGFLEPHEQAQESLMQAIFKGVKANDTEATISHGMDFVNSILPQLEDLNPDGQKVILAGCTEIPQVLHLLRSQADVSPAVNTFLELPVLDPVALALSRLPGGR